jgi:hypothetical protein
VIGWITAGSGGCRGTGHEWHWADASGVPLILRGLRPGQHSVLLELADANHQILDRGIVTFVVPEQLAK